MMRSLLVIALVLCASLLHSVATQDPEVDIYADEADNNLDESAENEPITVCGNVTGWWRNKHGSDLFLKVIGTERLAGRYVTAVETTKGAAGNAPVLVSGSVIQSLITFHAAWQDGESMATWIGQCHRVNGRIVIEASWILKTKVADCDDHWMSNRFGQETFVRSSGPGSRTNTARAMKNIRQ